MKIIFLGTPEISACCLKRLINSNHEILAVVTKPDKPVGRGNKMQETPVKQVAKEANLPVLEFNSVSKEGVSILKNLKPDALVLVAFGQILSKEVLEIALPVNLHGSLLPDLRGPSPIQSAILNGYKKSGVSVMVMAEEVDSGDIILQEEINIDNDETSGSLFEKMGDVGAEVLVKALDLIESKKAVFLPQDHTKATFTQMLTKQNAKLDFNKTTAEIINKVKAYNPAPVAYFEYDEKKYKVFKAGVYEGIMPRKMFKNGEVVFANSKLGFVIKTQDGFLSLEEIQAPNGKVLKVKDFLNGAKFPEGVLLN